MKTFILTIILCSLSTLGFAGWQTFADTYGHLSEKGQMEWFRREKGKFYLTYNYKGPGTSLSACNASQSTFVKIRKINDKYDICVSLNKDIFENEGKIYLGLLDRDGFELGEIYIGSIGQNYCGNIYNSYSGDWNGFNQIYSYEIKLRG